MSDLPENVTLEWLGRRLLAQDRKLQALQDDVSVIVATLRRLDNAHADDREEMRPLFDLHRELRKRVETVEDAQ